MSRTLFVESGKGTFTPNGTIEKPFRTIQDAVNAAAKLKPAPSAADPVTIAILQGIYKENVFIDIDGLALRGLGGAATVRVRPDTGPALVITNATQQSPPAAACSRRSTPRSSIWPCAARARSTRSAATRTP